MENLEQVLSLTLWPLLEVLVYGIGLYFVFQLGKRVLLATAGRTPWHNTIQDNWPIALRIFWALFALTALVAFVQPNPVIGGVLAILLVASLWPYIRSYISGIVILLGGKYIVGQSIRFEEYSGKIVSLNNFDCEIELDLSGKEVLSVPYSKLTSSLVVKTSLSENIISHTTVVDVPKPCNVLEAESKIDTLLIEMPWLVSEKDPTVEQIEESEEKHRFRVIMHGIDKAQLMMAEQSLKESLQPVS